MTEMELLVFKLIVTPLLLLAATLAIRRWGQSVGGLLVGLPLTSGPISLFLALDHGPGFAAQATQGSLTATVAQSFFCLVYCKLAYRGIAISLLAACAVYGATAVGLNVLNLPATALLVIALAGMTLVLRLILDTPSKPVSIMAPWWDIPLRMAFIALLVVAVKMVAPYIGPNTSGVVASFPFMATILAVFAQQSVGERAAQQVLRGMVAGLYGFALFFNMLTMTLEETSLVVAYGAATACALLVQGAIFLSMSRRRYKRQRITTQPN